MKRRLLTWLILLCLCLQTAACAEREPLLRAGGSFCYAISADGVIWGWGDGRSGQLGNGSKRLQLWPAHAANGLDGNDVLDIQCGNVAALFLMKDGTLRTCGFNNYFQQGSKKAGDKYSHVTEPIAIEGLTDIVQIACGYGHCLARTADGHVWAWGRNTLGQVGVGTRNNVPEPTLLKLENIIDIQCGGHFSLVMDSEHRLWGWGENENWQLGAVGRTNKPVTEPVLLPVNESHRFEQIAAGGSACYGIDADGVLWAWGRNDFYQLGRQDAGKRSPEAVRVGLPEGVRVTGISAYNVCQMAQLENGQIWQWGGSYEGQLGIGSNPSRSLPVDCTPKMGDAERMAVSSLCSYLMLTDGRVIASGYNKYGQTGTDINNRNDVLRWSHNGLNLLTATFEGP